MARFRRLLTYAICVAVATPPVAYGQAAPVASAPTGQTPSGQTPSGQGLVLAASQHQTYARLLMTSPPNMQANATASLGGGLVLIRLQRPSDIDPSVFARNAPEFVGGAALSADKRTIRLALVQGARLVESRDGDTQAFDIVLANAPDPAPFSKRNLEASAQAKASDPTTALERAGPPKKMINGQAPVGAPRVRVEASVSDQFTRVRLTHNAPDGALPSHGFARSGDRFAIAMPGQFALDVASMRARPPVRILDAARHTSPTNTALVMDVEAGAVVRHRRDGRSIVVDIMPAGSNPDAVDALIAQAAASTSATPSPKAPAAKAPTAQAPMSGTPTPGAPEPVTSTTVSEPPRQDPAPSGRVAVIPVNIGGKIALEFGFESQAPAVIFRRGEAIYALFSTAATFDVSQVKAGSAFSTISAIGGEGVAGVRLVAPPNMIAVPSAVGDKWRVVFHTIKENATRTIAITREQVADGTSRINASVPDAAAIGSIIDPVVGDTLLLGLAMGPPSPLPAPRAFLEAILPETFHGLVVAPKTEDFELRRGIDGFVLVRPMGMALSDTQNIPIAGALTGDTPGVVDLKSWQLGPKANFTRNLDQMRRAAVQEMADGAGGVQKRMDLARFLVAWDLGAEATGVLTQLKSDVTTLDRAAEFIALEGIAKVMQGRGKEGLEILSQPEIVDDPASQLWAGLAAQQSGNSEEALVRFGRGASAIGKFGPGQRAVFLLANARALLETGNADSALLLAGRAQTEAMDMPTRQRAGLAVATAQGRIGKIDDALANLTILAGGADPEVSSRARYEKAILAFENDKATLPETIRALDALRYAWRGDDLEINLLRRLGELYIKGGDIRSGLTTMTSATSLRTDLPAARLLRDELFKQFKYLFLEGGADGMPPVQALALFYDFKDLAPIGPEGDRMVRGLADRLVALDLLPQATQLLQHQVDKRLEGFAKAQVATDLAAIYLMDRRAEDALKAIWNSRVTQLPEALNAQRRMIEAAALAELGRTEHGLEIIEFDTSQDAARLRAELHLRAGDWTLAATSARATLPIVKASLEPEEAGEVLRTAIASTLAGQNDAVANLVIAYGPAMGKSALAEAFNVVTNPAVPEPAVLQKALASVTGGSPYHGLMKRLRGRLADLTPPEALNRDAADLVQVPTDPTDGDSSGVLPPAQPLVPAALPTAAQAPSAQLDAPMAPIAAR